MKQSIKLSKAGKRTIGMLFVVVFLVLFVFFRPKPIDNHNIEETKNYIVKIDYPTLDNKKILKESAEFIDNKKEEFIDSIKDLDLVGGAKYDFIATYSLNKMNEISGIKVTIFYYTGGNHYIREDKSYYYNENTKEFLGLKDFLKNDQSLDKLSVLAYYYLMEYASSNDVNILDNVVKDGTKADFKNYEHFNLTSAGLEVTFVPYQVASWADGEIKITIPYKDLTEVLKDEYIKDIDIIKPEEIKPEVRDLEEFKDKKLIAFTFDDGPGGKYTDMLLDGLDKYDAKVTFFVLGNRVNQFANNIRRAYKEGNQIGSHTYNHLNLYRLNDYDILKEVKNTNKAIRNIIGVEPTILRPPYGNINSKIKSLTNMHTILWDVDTLDWKNKNKDKVKEEVLKHAHDGAIVLFHDIYKSSVEGALEAMEKLYQDGYRFVTIDEMATLKGVTLDYEKSYFSF